MDARALNAYAAAVSAVYKRSILQLGTYDGGGMAMAKCGGLPHSRPQERRVKASLCRDQDQHCAICKDAGEGLMLCASCSTTQHASCMIEFGGCSGCGEVDPHAAPPIRSEVEPPAQVKDALCDPSYAYCHYPAGQQHYCPYHRITATDDVGILVTGKATIGIPNDFEPVCHYCLGGRTVPEGDEYGDGTSSCPKCCPQVGPEPHPRWECRSCAPHKADPDSRRLIKLNGCECCSCWRGRDTTEVPDPPLLMMAFVVTVFTVFLLIAAYS